MHVSFAPEAAVSLLSRLLVYRGIDWRYGGPMPESRIAHC